MMDGNRAAGRRNFRWVRPAAWAAGLAIILHPLVAMQLAPGSGVNWSAGDFLFAAIVVGAVGLAFELAVRIGSGWRYRSAAALGLAAGALLLWSNAAVGYIGDDNPYNIVFFLIVALAFLGALASGFGARGMAWTMLAAGIAHAAAGAIGFPQDPVTGPITLGFSAMWLSSAWLFHRSAQDCARAER